VKDQPLRTTVIGSYPFPGWLEFASQHMDQFGPDDLKEVQEDAVVSAVRDQFVPECCRLNQPYRILRAGERLTLAPGGRVIAGGLAS